MTKYITVKIETSLTIDVDGWAHEYGIDPKDVRADVKTYFAESCHGQLETLGLGKPHSQN